MRLLLVRHAKAETHDHSRWPDDSLRPLSEKGIKRFQQSAAGLSRVVTPDALVTSPYTRAVQTASVLHETAGWPEPTQSDAIPDAEFGVLIDEHTRRGTGTLALVGHEPSLSRLVSTLVSGTEPGHITMKPGAAALIELFPEHPPLSGRLIWLVQPKLSRAMAE